MLNDFISTIAAALFVGLIVFLISHLSKKYRGVPLAKWVMPAAAGATIIVYSIWIEYTWYSHMRAGMPKSVVVLQEVDESVPWRPWSYLFPMVVRFMALDSDKVTHPIASAPQLAQTDMLLIGRWRRIQTVPTVYDCATNSRADLLGGAKLAPDGTLSGAQWLKLPAQDPGLRAVCSKG
ncbi:hypothetical protein [uncultured Thioclava sp.]|jgi:hypothetical protein|uniref:hypothetical protein n=1 Tax=uncultured Thioclava sp. TaxID=473858 RepID=UPI0025D9AEB8|nr:hypothetical protein [uncultured Thioclava sp.]